jgi:hypothetical protein
MWNYSHDEILKCNIASDTSIDDEAETILKIFREKRDEIAKDINIPVLNGDSKCFNICLIFAYNWRLHHTKFVPIFKLFLFSTNSEMTWPVWPPKITSNQTILAYTVFRNTSPAAKEVSAEDILIAEGTATLELADKQSEEGMHREAARNYHTATVYFRVLESMVPRLTSRVHAVSFIDSWLDLIAMTIWLGRWYDRFYIPHATPSISSFDRYSAFPLFFPTTIDAYMRAWIHQTLTPCPHTGTHKPCHSQPSHVVHLHPHFTRSLPYTLTPHSSNAYSIPLLSPPFWTEFELCRMSNAAKFSLVGESSAWTFRRTKVRKEKEGKEKRWGEKRKE